jgi:hypothetical protein
MNADAGEVVGEDSRQPSIEHTDPVDGQIEA